MCKVCNHTPKIFVRLGAAQAFRAFRGRTDTIYRVKQLISQRNRDGFLICFDRRGKMYNLYLDTLRGLTPSDCTFFRGVTAELLYIILFLPMQFTNQSESQDAYFQTERMKEVASAIPQRLWAESCKEG